jgi:beta-N-acetylhexosaminidase
VARRASGRRGRRRPASDLLYRRRRRAAAAALVGILSAILIGLELLLSDPIPIEPGATVASIPSQCSQDSPDALRRQLGQRLVVRMESEADPKLLRQARRGEIGGVILFPPPGSDQAALADLIERLQEAAARASEHPLVVAIDQEGGEVKRLPEAPPALAPSEIAAADASTAAEAGSATGRELASLGVNVDLAPVLDVPQRADSFLVERAFGSTPGRVAKLGVAFAEGLAQEGVAATAKHFPGLGRSETNTDLAPSEIEAGPGTLRADLAPFERAIASPIALVMLSNAVYPRLDREAPAFASPAIAVGLLREELGFDGVTITDDLGAAAVRERFPRRGAALAAVTGGSDLLLFAGTASPGVLDRLVGAAERGELDRPALEASCARVVELRRGLAG